MLSVHAPETLIQIRNRAIAEGNSIGFVPTMGAIHKGHVSLVKRALEENDLVVCSIFVNPTQFNEQKDLDLYPRPIEEDMNILHDSGLQILFLPNVNAMYPPGYSTPEFHLGELENILEGKMRPGHFKGVAQVVDRLFNIVKPHRAYFGQKDFQQTVVVRKLINNFHPNIKLVVCPIIREEHGLAFSSRNERLTTGERQQASFIYHALKELQHDCTSMNLYAALERARFKLELVEGAELEYLEAVDAHTMGSVSSMTEADEIVAVTVVRFGGVRLLDNVYLKGGHTDFFTPSEDS